MHEIGEYVKSLKVNHDSIGNTVCLLHVKYRTLEMLYFQHTDQ